MKTSKAAIIESIAGIFAFDEEYNIIDVSLLPKKIKTASEAVIKLQRGDLIKEVSILLDRLLHKEYRVFVFENEVLAKAVREKFNIAVSIEKPSKAGEYLRREIRELAVNMGFVNSFKEFDTFMHDLSLNIARIGVKQASEKKDLIIAQLVYILDDLEKTLNLFANRLREWYGYYFPELWGFADKSTLYVTLIATLGERNNFTFRKVGELGLPAKKVGSISSAAKNSIGADADKRSVAEISGFAKAVHELYAYRVKLEHYLDDLMSEVAPNLRELVGSMLGARLIAATAGLENLSKKSSGTIQILGAERAIFRSLRTGTKPPKHGLIFQHKEIHQSPRWQRGKIARALAGKIAISSRLDFYGGAYRGGELKEEFNRRVEEIKRKYAEPPRKGKKR